MGNSNSSATGLNVAGTSVSGAGIIGKNTDVDVWSFTTGPGQISLSVNPFTRGPNLDILAKLYDGNGALVTQSNPVDSLSASFNLNLSGGEYYLHIDGTGKGDPSTGYSDYASLGQYTIAGEIVLSSNEFLSISPTKANENEGNSNSTPLPLRLLATAIQLLRPLLTILSAVTAAIPQK